MTNDQPVFDPEWIKPKPICKHRRKFKRNAAVTAGCPTVYLVYCAICKQGWIIDAPRRKEGT